MSVILCPVRGGPDSQPTIQRALSLAQTTDLKVVFLYVVNLDFLASTASSRSQVITHELTELGQFILDAACLQAERAGVQAETVVRHGNVVAQIIDVCQELDAQYILLGVPRRGRETNVLEHPELDNLAAQLHETTGAEVILVEPQ